MFHVKQKGSDFIYIIDKAEFVDFFGKCGFDVTDEQYGRFDEYAKLLVEKNKVMNLTGITDPMGITEKHFLDSVLIYKYADISREAKVIDVGTGAGFPGVPMKIYREDIKLTLLDSLQKRINFLKESLVSMNIDAEYIHSRAEDGGRNIVLRETFDVATARAVAPLPVLAEYCMPYVKVGGVFVAMKGPSENPQDAAKSVATLGGVIEKIEKYSLPCGDERIIVVIRKTSKTPSKYPRNSGQIAKKSL